MIYKSLDTIPAKLFFKIAKTGNVRLLTDDDSINEDVLLKTWQDLEAEDLELNPNPKANKAIDIYKFIESNLAKLKCINLALYILRIDHDKEIIEILKSYGYRFTEDMDKDLERIKRESSDINIVIERLKTRLPKQTESKEVPFDEVVIGYGAITGSGFIDTNTITKNQYTALIKVGNQKIKSLDGSKGKNKRR
ncbi:MAG: hypothetical protein ACPGRW_06145 [Flavobacteriaceae bacterium]